MECPLMPSVLARKLVISVAQPFINFLLLNSLITSLEHCEVTMFSKARRIGEPIASVCHGKLVLAAAGSVKGRKCTTFPAVRPVLVAVGAYWVEPETLLACVVDGNIITRATYEGHPELFRFFVKALGGNI
ncbi:Class I glutamine amidotransferase-like superfamily protein [Prunus dulcis]|uniref:Class I glutamine amidotransferase-like superfamily protein n=1 Tax=Prunus dulcis TaxID=3755 RepID=A0A4Y1RQE5_PRUDU|nr:Class I glutamine amidotransferase-like superfamily protein [Prunus dulcis]